MGIRYLVGHYDGDDLNERVVLIDSVTGLPLHVPMFESTEQADGFLAFIAGLGYDDDIRRYALDTQSGLHKLWIDAGKPEAIDEDVDDLPLVRARPDAMDISRASVANDIPGSCDAARCDADAGDVLCETHLEHAR